MGIYPTGGGTYRLQSSIGSTNTSITLSSFLEPVSGTPYTMALLNSDIQYGTIDPQTAYSEFISFTGITQNSDGTATLTGVTRGLGRSYPYTASSTFRQPHSGQAIFILSDPPELFNEYASKRNNETITGTFSFASVPNTSTDPVSGDDLARRSWVLSVVNGGAVTTSNLVVTATAGETVAAGNFVYLKAADGRWWKTDADDSTTTNNVMLGIAQGAGTAGNSISGGVLISGLDNNQSGLAAGTTYYLSNTAGAIGSSAGTNSKIIGVGRTATSIYFDPYFGELPTGAQKAALAGTTGTPSSTNKYLTQQILYSTPTDQSQLTQDTSTAVGEADATTKHNILAQSFVAGVGKTRGVTLYKASDTGTFTGTVTIALQADTAGSPSGVNLTSTTITNAAWLLTATGAFDTIFSAEYATTIGTTYWIVVTTSTADNSNHPNLGGNSAGGYASGVSKFKNTTDGWATNGTIDLYFATLIGIQGVVPVTSATTGLISDNLLPYTFVELNNTTTTVSNSSTETVVYTKIVPPGFFNASSGFKIKGWMRTLVLTTESFTITVYVNGTSAGTLTVFSGGTSAVSGAATYDIVVVNDGTGTSSQKSSVSLIAINGSTAVAQLAAVVANSTATSAIDTSGVCTIQVKMQMSGSSSCSFTNDSVVLEKIG